MFAQNKGTRRKGAALAALTAIATLGIGLVAPASVASAAESGDLNATDVTFQWGVNDESGGGAYFGGCNFLSAGEAGDNGAAGIWPNDNTFYSTKSGNVEILKPTADGTLAEPTWKSKCTNQYGTNINSITAGMTFTPTDSRKDPNAPADAPAEQPTYSGNVVRISNGSGTVNPDTDSAHIEWKGSFTIVYYGGMTYWSVTDPVLDIKDGKGTITATASGYGADMDDASKWLKLDPQEIHIADLQNTKVDVTDKGISVTPDFLGVKVPEDVVGRNDQVEKTDANAAWWGSFPASWLKFSMLTGQTSYWWTSAGTAKTIQIRKPASPITITYTATKPGPSPDEVGVTGSIEADPLTIDPTKDQKITVTGKGYTGDAAAYGTYVVIADKSIWQPGQVPTNQAAFPVQKWVRPANDPKDGYATLDKDGNWTQVLDIPANTLDPSKQYVVGTFAAHMLSVTNRNLDHAIDLTVKVPEPVATVPDAPAKPTATAASTSSVKVEWKAPANDGNSAITGYKVTLTPSAGDPVVQEAAADATSVTFDKLDAQGVSYTATVVAVNAKGDSAPSAASDPVVPNADPSADLAVTVEPTADIDPDQDVTFTVKGTGFTGGAAANGAYVVVADTAKWNLGQAPTGDRDQFVASAWVKPANIKDGAFTTTVTVKAGTFDRSKTYVVGTMAAHQLSLTDRRLDTATAITFKALPEPEAPQAPAKPSAALGDNGDVTVTWAAPASDGGSAITGYKVKLTPSAGSGAAVTKTVDDPAATSVTFTTAELNAAKGVAYTAAVVAVNAKGDSAPSESSDPVTPNPLTAPGAPTGVTVATAGVHELTVNWAAPADNGGSAVTGYKVKLAAADGSGDPLSQDVDGALNTATFTQLDWTKAYVATVVAVNAQGDSDAASSDAAGVTPLKQPATLTIAGADGKAVDALQLKAGAAATLKPVLGGEQTEGVAVTWAPADDAAAAVVKVEPNADGSEATVTALKEGAADVVVSAVIDGETVTQKLNVTVAKAASGEQGNGGQGDGSTVAKPDANKSDAGKNNGLASTGAAVAGIALAAVVLAVASGAVTVLRRRAAGRR